MSLISSVLVASFIALVLAGGWYELRVVSRLRRAGLVQPRHKRRLRRRLLGLFFLTVAVALLVNAPAFEARFTDPFLRLGWIGMAFVCVLLAVWLAFRDLSETGRMAQEEAQRVVMESLVTLQDEIARAKQERSTGDEDPGPKQTTPTHGQSGKKTRRTRHPHRHA